MISAIANDILEFLNDDMVSHGLLMQCVQQSMPGNDGVHFRFMGVLEELLVSGRVEIGEVRMVTSDYVEFVAWKGTVQARLARAKEAIDQATGPNKEFAYWLCLQQNVDHYEGDTVKN
jgi:hypothetical protein